MLIAESIVEHAAAVLSKRTYRFKLEWLILCSDMDADEIRHKNFLKSGQRTPYGQVIEHMTVPQMWQEVGIKLPYRYVTM